MRKPVTLHLVHGTVYLDSDHDSRYSSSSQVLLESLDRLIRRISRCGDSDGLRMSAAGRAILVENSKAAPDEVAFVPPGTSEERAYRLPRVSSELCSGLGWVLDNRRSQRKFDALELTRLTDLLHYSARVQEITLTANGYPATKRPSPSAGARHPIDIVVVTGRTLVAMDCETLPSIWRYDELGHSAMSLPEGELSRYSGVVEAARVSLGFEPSAVLVLAAVPWRTLSRYPAGAGFLLLDAGALLGTLHFVACGLGIAACPIAISALGFDEPDVALGVRVPVVGLAIGGIDANPG